jgi:lantibiotic modifying enzyme
MTEQAATNACDRPGAAQWREAGLAIARDLAANAIWSDGMCTFHGATAPESRSHPPRYRSMGADLYEGSAGIARFLGVAATMSGVDGLRGTAIGAARHALAHAEGWSLFTGGTGAALVALELAERLDEPSLRAPGTDLLDRSADAACAAAAPYDFLVGTAGVVLGLLGTAKLPGAGERALRLGRALWTAGVDDGPDGPDGRPLSWPLERGSPLRLCGLAHGASGVALAFDALGRCGPDGEFWSAAARRARTYERAHYSAEAGSWADLRPPEPGSGPAPLSYPHMWCHGSVGIAAERLAAADHDPLAAADAAGGLAGARAHAELLLSGPVGPGAGDEVNASLCHGLAGLVDLFLDAWDTTGDPGWVGIADGIGDLMLNDARRCGGWRSGLPGGWPAPGLMLGRAGTGWALLRLAAPTVVPSGWRPITG